MLDDYGGYRPGLARITLTGANQRPRRFIHPPTFEWEPVSGAAAYRVVLWSGAGRVHDVTVSEPKVTLAPAWPQIPDGSCRLTVYALDAGGALVGVSVVFGFFKAPGWRGETAPARFPYAETATQIVRWLTRDVGVDAYDPAVPPYIWHSIVDPTTDSLAHNNRAYPALHHPKGIEAFLAYATHGEDPALRDEALRRARDLADFNIAHSTPADHTYAYLPYHTISQGQLGLHGGHRPDLRDVAEPNKAGLMGVAYLDLFAATGETKYRDAAQRIADTLVATQNPDGSWNYRVSSETGRTEEPYTSGGVLALMLMDRMRQALTDARYERAYQAILDWMLANPLRTGRWENSYDDTRYSLPYANPGVHDALFMGRFLAERAGEIPRFLELAVDVFRWVDDNFVLYRDDPRVPYRPHTPSVTEQWSYYWPMNSHTANWLLFLVRLWEATGDEGYRQRAIGAANVITQCQMTDGRSTTWVPDVDSETVAVQRDWLSCMFLPVTALLEAETKLGK